MTMFNVETATLHELAQELFAVQQTLGGLDQLVDGYDGRLGSASVEGTLHGFADHWSQGTTHLQDAVTSLQQIVAGAAHTYEQAEQAIVKAADAGT